MTHYLADLLRCILCDSPFDRITQSHKLVGNNQIIFGEFLYNPEKMYPG